MRRTASIVISIGPVLGSLFIGLAIMEVAFRLYPEAFPDNLRALIETDDATRHARKAVVERLPHSPFAKPYSNVDVFIPGYFGPKDNFVYEWHSDHRGFKNLPEIARREQIDVIALGDNHTEGVGVTVEDTWTTRLTRKGYPTYNLAIQGYAPTQFLGAYEHYGRALRPKWVVVGLFANAYRRERYFFGEMANADSWAGRNFPDAIGDLQSRDELHTQRPIYLETNEGYRFPLAVNERHRFLTTAFIDLVGKSIWFARSVDIRAGIAGPDNDLRFASGAITPSLYRSEVVAARAEIDPNAFATSAEWVSTERAIERIAELSKTDGARVLVMFLPNRRTVYFRRVTGEELPQHSADLVQARLARKLAERNGLLFLDLTPIFQQVVAELADTSPVTAYPYLKSEGHESPRGHEIIARSIETLLRTNTRH
jgi:hypothetical protein